MNWDAAIELALDGHAVLFVGAGFSRGAINRLDQPLKSAPELAKHLAAHGDLPDGTSLDDAAEEFVRANGEERLVQELKAEFSVTQVTAAHKQIATIPWRRIYTTNYDNVIETAYLGLGRHVRPVTLSAQARLRRDNEATEILCVHLNGFIESLTRDTIGSELKLTDTSYLTASIDESAWATMFRQDLSLARAVFFVGYSLADLDIRRIIHDSPQLQQKCFFVIGDQAEEAIKRRVSRFGTAQLMNTDAFAEELLQKSNIYVPQEPEEHIGYSIKRFEGPEVGSSFSDQSVFDLLLLGNLKPDFVWKSLHEGNQYFLERPPAQRVLDSVENGTRVAVIHSELGNGKTHLLEGIKCRALENGYQVFSAAVRNADTFRELDQVLTSKDKSILFIDDYPDWIDVIERFGLIAKPNTALVLSARSAVHDVLVDDLSHMVGQNRILEYTVDLLTNEDLEWIVTFFDQYGLWGEKAAWSKFRKIEYLSRECRSQFSSILMTLFESPQIASRFERLFERLNNKRKYYEVLLSIMILAVVQRSSTIDLLIDIWGSTIMETQFKKDEAIREFVDVQAGEVKLRSATAAQFILKHVANVNYTVDALVETAKAMDRAARNSETHQFVMRNMMRFSTVQTLLPEAQRRPATIRYYEGIKNLYACGRNPQFWLQYAIACLTLGELDRAERYFDTAYSFSKRLGHSTHQIDNHYARFLLVRSVEQNDPSKCMTSFRKAREIIDNQIRDNRMQYRHYPYRVARSYLDFYQAFENALDPERLEEIKQTAVFVIRRIDSLPADRRQHRSVSECFDAMQRIITRGGDVQPANESFLNDG